MATEIKDDRMMFADEMVNVIEDSVQLCMSRSRSIHHHPHAYTLGWMQRVVGNMIFNINPDIIQQSIIREAFNETYEKHTD